MDTRVLTYFLMVARERNITRAARLLHMTQPTLSRQLQQLERELNTQLLVRTNRRVSLTDEGLLFERRAREIVALAEKAHEEVRHEDGALVGTVSICCNELRSVRELARVIGAFQARYPRVKFEIDSGANDEIMRRLEQGTADAGLFIEPAHLEAYATVPLRTKERWGVLIHESAPLARRDAIRPGDLVGTPVFTIHVNTPEHGELAKWSGPYASGMDFCATYNVLYNAVVVAREQRGAVICLERDCIFEHMKFLPFDPPLESQSVLAWKDGRATSYATRTFLRFARDELHGSGRSAAFNAQA